MMLRGVKIVFALVALVIVGCSRGDQFAGDADGYVEGDMVVGFDNATLTKGAVMDEEDFDQMDVYAYYTYTSEWSKLSANPPMIDFMENQLVEKATADDTWSYSPARYWPANTDEKITFFAFTPYNTIVKSLDDDGIPVFGHTLYSQSETNNDLSVGVAYDRSSAEGEVKFDMEHALTRIAISARTVNAPTAETSALIGEYNVSYSVNGVTFHGVESKGVVSIDADGNISWESTYDASNLIDITSTQGKTLKPYADAILLDYDSTLDTEDDKYTEVSNEGMTTFVMPQEFANLTTHPTVELRVRKSYQLYDDEGVLVDQETIYSSGEVEIPTVSKDANDIGKWVAGEWINLQFTFDIEDPDLTTPMTVVSVPYVWTEVDIDVEVNRNIYIYSDCNDTIYVDADATTADMRIFTNYQYDLREPATKTELDGTETESKGFVFFFEDAANITVNTVPLTPIEDTSYTGDGKRYKIDSDISTTADDFYYVVSRTTRGALGIYSSTALGDSEPYGVNKSDDDYVYTLTIEINENHLTTQEDGSGEFSGTIGVQMLSNAGGMITQLFPITLNKAAN